MADQYQRGTDSDWLEHSNQELKRLVKKRERTIAFLKFNNIILLIALAWVVFRYSKVASIRELWPFQ